MLLLLQRAENNDDLAILFLLPKNNFCHTCASYPQHEAQEDKKYYSLILLIEPHHLKQVDHGNQHNNKDNT